MVAMAFRHVCRRCAITRVRTPRVRGNQLTRDIDLEQVIEGVEFHLAADMLMRNRVMVLLVFHVVIDIHLGLFDVPITPGLCRQRP